VTNARYPTAPDFLRNSLALMNFMRLSSMKAVAEPVF
jgi:hypothetical protein